MKRYAVILLTLGILLTASCSTEKAPEETTETSVDTTAEIVTTVEETTVPVEETTTTTTEITTTEVTTTTAVTEPPLPPTLTESFLGEEYSDTFYLRPESKSNVSDITLSVVSKPNVSIRATTVVDDEVFAQAEIATAESGAKVYNTRVMHFPVKFLVTEDQKVYIINDRASFYYEVTDNPYYDVNQLSAANVNYNYTLIGNTADHVILNDVTYTRMQATDNNNGLYEVLYFDEEGLLKFIYTPETAFGVATTSIEYIEVDSSYFNIPQSYTAYNEEQYLNYMNSIMKDLGYSQIVPKVVEEQTEEIPVITTPAEE